MSDLQDKISAELAEQLCSDIDFQILSTILVDSGWHRVVLTPMTKEESDAIDQWIDTNVKGQYNNRGLVWIFEDRGDAVNFTLKWA